MFDDQSNEGVCSDDSLPSRMLSMFYPSSELCLHKPIVAVPKVYETTPMTNPEHIL